MPETPQPQEPETTLPQPATAANEGITVPQTAEAISQTRLAELFALTEGLVAAGHLKESSGHHYLTLPSFSLEQGGIEIDCMATVRFGFGGILEIEASFTFESAYRDTGRWTINQDGITTSRHKRIGNFGDLIGILPPESETFEYVQGKCPYNFEKAHRYATIPRNICEIESGKCISPPAWLVEHIFSQLEAQYKQQPYPRGRWHDLPSASDVSH